MAEAAQTSPQDADQISDRLEAILAFDSRPHLEAVSCPTLVMTGADDQLMPDWFGRELAAGIPNAKLVALTGGGHMLPETRSDDVSNAVSRSSEKVPDILSLLPSVSHRSRPCCRTGPKGTRQIFRWQRGRRPVVHLPGHLSPAPPSKTSILARSAALKHQCRREALSNRLSNRIDR